jgi:hypothetical protein
MIKICEQVHISQQFSPSEIMMINNMLVPRTCRTRCYFITKEELKDLNELVYEFSKHPLINCDTSDIERTATPIQKNGKKALLLQWISDLQDKVLKDYFPVVKAWNAEQFPHTTLHTVAFRFEEI